MRELSCLCSSFLYSVLCCVFCFVLCLVYPMLQVAVVIVIVWQLDLLLPVQSVSITTKVVSSNPEHDEVYSIQHYVINLSVTVAGRWFSRGIPVSSINKTDRHDITEILLKVALNTITLTQCYHYLWIAYSWLSLLWRLYRQDAHCLCHLYSECQHAHNNWSQNWQKVKSVDCHETKQTTSVNHGRETDIHISYTVSF